MLLTGNAEFLWVIDRIQNVAEVFDTDTGERVNTVDLKLGGPQDLAPDLADISRPGIMCFSHYEVPIHSAATHTLQPEARPDSR